MRETPAPVEFEHLTVDYGNKRALCDLSLRVPQGSIFALLGRNGAGKTSALRCLLGFQEPTYGKAHVLGHDAATMPAKLRNRIGFVSENHGLVGWMTIRWLMRFQNASFESFDIDRCREEVGKLGLSERQRVSRLSRGQRAQLALALVVAQNPELVVLDDPALGLDAVVRRGFLETMIEMIQQEGRTLLFTSHLLGDVERVCDHVAILDKGELLVNAPLDTVKERITRVRATFEGTPPDIEWKGVVRAAKFRNELTLTMLDATEEIDGKLKELGAKETEHEPLSLEDIFVDYTTGEAA